MLDDMAERASRPPKIIVNARVDPETVAKLDELADKMRPRPSRSEMVDLAIAEYVERHYPASQHKKNSR